MKALVNTNPPTSIIVTKKSTSKSVVANIKRKQKRFDKKSGNEGFKNNI